MSAVQIEEKVVKMTFDNSTFDSKIAASKMALENFKKALNFNDETTQSTQQAVNSLKNIISSVNFSGIENSLDAVSNRFSVMGIVGMNVINKLTDGVINLGQKILFAIPNQIKTGGWNRAMNVADAKFQLSGLEIAWEDVADAIDHAVLGTAYGADAAAKAAAQLATTGVNYKNAIKDASGNVEVWDDMARSLRAISGVAAMTNSSYEEIADVFTSIAGAGKAQLGELNRLSYRGLRAQNAIADHLGVSLQEVDELIHKGKIDFQTFADAMDEAFGEHATRADVTLRGSMDNMKASLSRIGQDFAQTIFTEVPQVFNAIKGFFNKIRTFTRPFADNIFTPVFAFYMDKVRTIIENVTSKIPTLEKGSKALEDYNRVLKSLGHITTSVVRSVINIGKMFEPIKKAFNDVFGLPSIEQLEKFGNSIVQFSHRLKLNSEVADNVRRTFRGFFSAIKIIGDAFTQIGGKIIPPVISLFKKAAENVLKLTAAFGDYVTNLEESISKNKTFAKVTEKTIDVVRSASTILKGFFSSIADKFKSFFSSLSIDTSIFNNFFSNVSDKLKSAISWIGKLGEKFKGIMPIFSAIGQGIGNITKQLFSGLFSAIEAFVKSSSYVNLMDLIKGVLLTDMTVNFGVFIKRVLDMFGGGAMTLRNVFDVLTDLKNTLIVFQMEVKANIIRSIAISLGILAASLYVISTIDTEKVILALGAISAMMYGLMTALKSFNGVISDMMGLDTASGQFTGFIGSLMKLFGISTGTAKYAALSFTMMAIGAAILELSVAIKIIASCPIGKAAVALAAILVLMKAMTQVLQKLGAIQAKFIPGSLAMIALATSMIILAKAIKILSDLPFEQVATGLFGVAGGLSVLVIALIAISKYVENPMTIGSMIGLIAMAGSIYILGKAIVEIAAIPWENLVVSLTAVGLCIAAMTGVAIALSFFPLAAVGGIAFIEMAAAIYILGAALSKLSEISWDKLENALNALSTCLTLLVKSAIFMSFASPLLILTAPGLIALAIAITMLTPALILLSKVPLADLAKAVGILTIMVGMFSGLSFAGIFTPLMLGLATSIASLAKSILILVPALIALSSIDMNTIQNTTKILRKFITSMELLSIGATLFLPAFLALAGGMAALAIAMSLIASGANAFMGSFDNVINYLIGAVEKIAEFVVKLATAIGEGIYNALQDNCDEALLALADIINKLAAAIEESVDVLLPALNNLVESLFYALGELITDLPAVIGAALKGLGRAFGVEQEVLDGIDEMTAVAEEGLGGMFQNLIDYITPNTDSLGSFIIDGIKKAILGRMGILGTLGAKVGDTIIKGILSKYGIDAHSPSRRAYAAGTYVNLGFMNGISSLLPNIFKSGEGVGKTAIDGIKSGIEKDKKILTDGIKPSDMHLDNLNKQIEDKMFNNKKQRAIEYSARIGYKLDTNNIDDIERLYGLSLYEQNIKKSEEAAEKIKELREEEKKQNDELRKHIEENGKVLDAAVNKIRDTRIQEENERNKQAKKQQIQIDARREKLEEFTNSAEMLNKKYAMQYKKTEEDITQTTIDSYNKRNKVFENGITGYYAKQAADANAKSNRVQQMIEGDRLENNKIVLEQEQKMYNDKLAGQLEMAKRYYDMDVNAFNAAAEFKNKISTDEYKAEQERIRGIVREIKLANESNSNVYNQRQQDIDKLTLKEKQMGNEIKQTTILANDKIKVFLHSHDAERALKEQTEKNTGALIENKRALKENGEQMDETAKKAKALKNEMSEMHDSIEKDLESKTGGMNFFNKLELKSETTATTLLENMQSNVDGVASWTARLGQLMEKGLDKGLVKTLADAGLSSYDQISAFLQMTDEQIAHANELFLKAAEGRAYSANTISQKYYTLGSDNMQGMIDGIASKEKAVSDQAVEVAENAHKNVETLEGHASPSKWWIQLGTDNMQGLDIGMLEGAEKYVFQNIVYITNRIHSICREHMTGQNSEIYNIGLNFSKGLSQGILAGETEIIDATKKVTSLIPKESKDALEEKSPSKLAFRIGRFFDMGLINGLTDLQNELKMTSRNVASSAIDPMVNAFNDTGKLLGNNLDFNPVIKPSFDISEVTNGMADVSSMFDRRRSIEIEAQTNSWSNPTVRDSFLDTFANRIGLEYADRVVDAINNKDMDANVHLEGDAEGIFKVVRKGNRAFMRRTGYSGI